MTGSHESIMVIETANYPEFNGVLRIFDSFDVVVTAACWNTVVVDPAVTKIVHPVRTASITYTIPTLLSDSVSTNGAHSGFCGPMTYQHVSLTSPEFGSPDQVASFDGTDTYTFDGQLDSQWGNYVVTFGVTLDDYPDFVRQDFSFDVEIVPDCNSAIV